MSIDTRGTTGGLLLLWTLAACGGEAAPPEVGVPSPQGAAAIESEAAADLPQSSSMGGELQGEAGARISGFAPGGPISDEALAEHHVQMEIEVDGEIVGTLAVELWAEDAPVTVRNFLRLVDEGFYDGLSFHRVLREFMVQGGCPNGNGTGNSPYGTIPAEFSTEPHRDHRYGVLSMARMGGDDDSASCQFFFCCDDGPALWNLDGSYTTFGRLTKGVPVLEAMASVPVRSNRGEPSAPTVEVKIARAWVESGAAPQGTEDLRRPGRPEPEDRRVVLHTLVVQCAQVPRAGVRTVDAAQELAQELERRAAEEGVLSLVREHSDEPGAREDERFGVWRVLAEGVRDREGQFRVREVQRDLQARLQEAANQLGGGEITRDEYIELSRGLSKELSDYLVENRWRAADELSPSVREAAFELEVGERRLVPFDPVLNPRGFTLLERVE